MNNKMKVAVLGAGVMGTGIAQLFATKGYPVTIIYVYDDAVRAKPIETMKENLKVLCDNGVLEETQIPSILANVTCTEDLEGAAKSSDILFECIVEDLATKQEYFRMLDSICEPETILATNTSVISVTEIAEKAVHKERIIGTHFWKPAYIIPLVEIVKTEYVSENVVDKTFKLLTEADKKPVIVQKDVPGFLANRMQHALFREAISIVEKGIASPADVDTAIKYGFGMRLGVMAPMEVIDSGGIDLTYNIHKYLFPNIENSTKPSPLLKKLLDEGELGFKTGEGFQKWSPSAIHQSQQNLIEGLIKVEKALDRL